MTPWKALLVVSSAAVLPMLGGCDAAAIAEKGTQIEASADGSEAQTIRAVSVRVVAPGDECPYGGARLIGKDGSEALVCNGAPGTAPSTASLPTGNAHCAWGGIAVTSAGDTVFLCNGKPGTDGASVSVATLSPGHATCSNGGIAVTAADGTTFVCNGTKGAPGTSVTTTAISAGDSHCPAGGVAVTSGLNTSYICNGAAGASVTTATVGAGAVCVNGGIAVWSPSGLSHVCNGINGNDGKDGADGVHGSDGSSVTTSPLPVGDPNCPYGGSAFHSLGATSYACNGAPAGEAAQLPLAPELSLRIEVNGTEVGFFQQFSGLGAEIEVIDRNTSGPSGEFISRDPGNLRYKTLRLRQGLVESAFFETWRTEVMNATHGFEKTLEMTFHNERGDAVATWTLQSAWPSSIEYDHGSTTAGFSGTTVAAIAIEYAGISLQTSGKPLAGAPAPMAHMLAEGVDVMAYKITGLGNRSNAMEQLFSMHNGRYEVRKIPGSSEIGHLQGHAAFTAGSMLWNWHMALHQSATPYRKNLSVTLLNEQWQNVAEWSLVDAWMNSFDFAVGPAGILEERFTIVANEFVRVN